MQQTTQQTENTELDLLCFQLEEAKQAEKEASNYRKSIEEQLLALIPDRKEGTNKTVGNHYKLTVTESLGRKVSDPIGLSKAVSGAEFDKLIRIKYELNTRSLKAFEELQPEVYSRICEHIETAPRKPSVKVESI